MPIEITCVSSFVNWSRPGDFNLSTLLSPRTRLQNTSKSLQLVRLQQVLETRVWAPSHFRALAVRYCTTPETARPPDRAHYNMIHDVFRTNLQLELLLSSNAKAVQRMASKLANACIYACSASLNESLNNQHPSG